MESFSSCMLTSKGVVLRDTLMLLDAVLLLFLHGNSPFPLNHKKYPQHLFSPEVHN